MPDTGGWTLAEPTDVEPTPATSTPRRRQRKDPGTTPARKKNTRRIAVIAGTAALTTAVSGIVGGVVSPERVQSVLGLSDEPSASANESSSGSASGSPSPPALEFKPVTDRTGAISFEVPASWGRLDDGFVGIDGVSSPGLALRAGPDPNGFYIQSDETAYVGASTQAFDDLGLVGLDDGAVVQSLERRREGATHLSQFQCVPTSNHTPQLSDNWLGAAQAWQNCFGIEGWRALEVEMVSADRDVYVFIQIGLPAATSDEVAQRLLDSLDVLPGLLPVS